MFNIDERLKNEYGYDKEPRLLKEYKEAYLELLGIAKTIMIDNDALVSARKTIDFQHDVNIRNLNSRHEDMSKQLERAWAMGKTWKDVFEFVTKEKVGK